MNMYYFLCLCIGFNLGIVFMCIVPKIQRRTKTEKDPYREYKDKSNFWG